VPGYEASVWFDLVAPNGTTAEIVGKLNNEINAALADAKSTARRPKWRLGGSPADFGRLIAAESEKWAKVIRANIGPPASA
jgi:tripartite-type tricarboxylate transporter receptor subunit TctC